MAIQKQVNIPVTFQATDDTLTSHVWKINEIIQTGEVNPIFVHTFTAVTTPNIVTVSHEGTNACGSTCIPFSQDLEITLNAPTPPYQISSELIYATLAVGVVSAIGLAWYSLPKGASFLFFKK